jgi:TonB family protein
VVSNSPDGYDTHLDRCVLSFVGLCRSNGTAGDDKDEVKHCAPKIASKGKPSNVSIHVRSGEKRVKTPVIAFEVLPSGEVANARMKQRSGVQDIDRYALTQVRAWKFNNRPGCPVVESQCGVTIDFAAN